MNSSTCLAAQFNFGYQFTLMLMVLNSNGDYIFFGTINDSGSDMLPKVPDFFRQ